MEPFTSITAPAVPLPLKDIDTDMIIPAQFLTRISNQGYADALFRRLKDERADFALNQPRFADARILIAGSNFGCGSSREHAVWALRDGGFRVIISSSFADIFAGNSSKNGLVLVTLAEELVDRMLRDAEAGAYRLTVDLARQTVELPDGSAEPFQFDPFRKHCILNGLDDLDYLISHRDRIAQHRAAASTVPARPAPLTDESAATQRYLLHMATGGMSHMLIRLVHSFQLARATGRTLVPLTRHARGIQLDFYDIFAPGGSKIIASPEQITAAGRAWSPPDSRFPESIFELNTIHCPDPVAHYYQLRGVENFRGTARYLDLPPEAEDRLPITAGAYTHSEVKTLHELLLDMRLRSELSARARALRATLPERFIGLHYRGTDRLHRLDELLPPIRAAVERSGCTDLFVATDSIGLIGEVTEALPDLRILCNQSLIDVRRFKAANLHYVPETHLIEIGRRKEDIHTEFFADVFCLAQAVEFVPSEKSGARHLVSCFRRYPQLLSWFYGDGGDQTRPDSGKLQIGGSVAGS